jgi:hypothetical protein
MGISRVDRGRANRRLAGRPSYEGRWVRSTGRHYPRDLGRGSGMLGIWAGGHDWLDLDQAKSKRRSPSPRCRIAGGRKRL